MCTTAGDVAHKLKSRLHWSPTDVRPIPDHLPESHRLVLDILSRGAASREHVVALSGLGTIGGMRAVAALELAGYVVEEGFFLTRVR